MLSFSVSLGLEAESRWESDHAVTPLKPRNPTPADAPMAASLCRRRNLRVRYSLPGGEAFLLVTL
jgi:hypothetical protein